MANLKFISIAFSTPCGNLGLPTGGPRTIAHCINFFSESLKSESKLEPHNEILELLKIAQASMGKLSNISKNYYDNSFEVVFIFYDTKDFELFQSLCKKHISF